MAELGVFNSTHKHYLQTQTHTQNRASTREAIARMGTGCAPFTQPSCMTVPATAERHATSSGDDGYNIQTQR